MSKRIETIIAAVAIVVVGATLRVPYAWLGVINLDETIYATIARGILRGEIPFRDFWEIKPPLVYYTYAVIFRFFGEDNLFPIHIASTVSVILTALVTADMGMKLWDRKTGFLAGIGVAVFSTSFWAYDMQAADTEIFMILPMMIGARLFVSARNGRVFAKLFAAGVFTSLAILFKQPAGAVAIMMALWIFLKPPEGKNRYTSAAMYCIGVTIPVVLAFVYFAAHGAFMDALDLMFLNNFKYMAERGKADVIYTMFNSGFKIAFPNMVFWLAGIGWSAAVIVGRIKKKPVDDSGDAVFFAALLVLANTIGAFSGVYLSGHYYMMMVPPMCLVWARLVMILYIRYTGAQFKELRPAMIAIVVFGTLLPFVNFHFFSGLELINLEIRANNNFERQLASMVRNLSGPDEKIFVWGLDPQVYYFADRKPAGRFLYTTFQMGLVVNSPRNAGKRAYVNPSSWVLLMQDLEKHKPKLFLDSSEFYIRTRDYPLKNYPQINSWVQKNYTLYTDFKGYKIYILRGS